MKQVGTEGLALFNAPAPPLGKKPTLGQRYAVWRGTKEGELVFREVEARCLEEARLSAQRISVARHVEQVRVERKWSINQNHRSFLARELVRCHPVLRDLIETRGAK